MEAQAGQVFPHLPSCQLEHNCGTDTWPMRYTSFLILRIWRWESKEAVAMAQVSIQFSQVFFQPKTSEFSTILEAAWYLSNKSFVVKYARVNFCFQSRILTGKEQVHIWMPRRYVALSSPELLALRWCKTGAVGQLRQHVERAFLRMKLRCTNSKMGLVIPDSWYSCPS